MHYQISRNGQLYGPYTLEDLERYLASGNVLPTDLAKSEEMPDWIPVSQLLANRGSSPSGAAAGAAPGNPSSASAAAAATGYTASPNASGTYANPGPYASQVPYTNPAFPEPGFQPGTLAASPYPDAPNLHWALVLLFSFLTCSLFMFIWNLVIAAWLKRVQPNATSLFFYIGAALLFLVQMIIGVPYSLHHAASPGIHMHTGNAISSLFGIAVWVVRLIARFSQRASLEEHFNGPEPIGLRLSGVMTFFFGGLYFQYHLNRINQVKLAARYGAGAVRTF